MSKETWAFFIEKPQVKWINLEEEKAIRKVLKSDAFVKLKFTKEELRNFWVWQIQRTNCETCTKQGRK